MTTKAELLQALREASEKLAEAAIDIEDWGSYANPYIQQKHDLAETVAQTKADAKRFADIARIGSDETNEPEKQVDYFSIAREFQIMHSVLQWNRSLPEPVIKIAQEYGVARKVLEFAAEHDLPESARIESEQLDDAALADILRAEFELLPESSPSPIAMRAARAVQRALPGERDKTDMALLIGRLLMTLRKYEPSHPLAAQAADFVKRKVFASPLRGSD